MVEKNYKISIDVARRIVRSDINGYWDLPTAMSYITDIRAATDRMQATGMPCSMLTHIGDSPPLPREVSNYMEKEQGNKRPTHVRKMAMVCFSMLGRLQLRRMTTSDRQIGVFANDADAEKWLAE